MQQLTVFHNKNLQILLNPDLPEEAKLQFMQEEEDSEELSRFLSGRGEEKRKLFELYMKSFEFRDQTIQDALRIFSAKFHLQGESQQVERILDQFAKRFHESNPKQFDSQETVNILTNAIVMLNTDLHNLNNPFKMSKSVFVQRVNSVLPSVSAAVLKEIYLSIKNKEISLSKRTSVYTKTSNPSITTSNFSLPFRNSTVSFPLQITNEKTDVYYFEGALKKKTVLLDFEKKPFSRSWKSFYVSLSLSLNFYKPIKVENQDIRSKLKLLDCMNVLHGLASPVEGSSCRFSFRTANGAAHILEASTASQASDWLECINYVASIYSAKPMPLPSSSNSKFVEPNKPSWSCFKEAPTDEQLKERLDSLKEMVTALERQIHNLIELPQEESFEAKLNYLNYEMKKYQIYHKTLANKINRHV